MLELFATIGIVIMAIVHIFDFIYWIRYNHNTKNYTIPTKTKKKGK